MSLAAQCRQEVLRLHLIFKDRCRCCAYTSGSRSHVTHLSYQPDSCRQSWDPNLGGQVLGPCPCAGQTYWPVAVYEQPGRSDATASGPCPCAGLLQACCGAKAPWHRFRLLCDGPVVADRCKFRSCTYTSVSRCPMSHSWFSRLWVKAGLGSKLRMRVLGPCPCAGQISWLVAVYEYPGRSRATASGPCPCAGQ